MFGLMETTGSSLQTSIKLQGQRRNLDEAGARLPRIELFWSMGAKAPVGTAAICAEPERVIAEGSTLCLSAPRFRERRLFSETGADRPLPALDRAAQARADRVMPA